MGGDTLALARSPRTTAICTGRPEALLAAFRAKYPEKVTSPTKLEPHADAIAPRKRDGLADYLISLRSIRSSPPSTSSTSTSCSTCRSEGCARTSRCGRGDLERPALRPPGAAEPGAGPPRPHRPAHVARAARTRSRPTNGRGARTTGSGRPTGRSSSTPRTTSSPSCATTRHRCSEELESDAAPAGDRGAERRSTPTPATSSGFDELAGLAHRRRVPRQGHRRVGRRRPAPVRRHAGRSAGRTTTVLSRTPHGETEPDRGVAYGAVAQDRRADPGAQGRARWSTWADCTSSGPR